MADVWNSSTEERNGPTQLSNVFQGTDVGEKPVYNYLITAPNSNFIYPLYCTENIMLILKKFFSVDKLCHK